MSLPFSLSGSVSFNPVCFIPMGISRCLLLRPHTEILYFGWRFQKECTMIFVMFRNWTSLSIWILITSQTFRTEWALMNVVGISVIDYWVIVAGDCLCICSNSCGTSADLFMSVLLNYKEEGEWGSLSSSVHATANNTSSALTHFVWTMKNDTTPDTANTAYLSCGCEKAISCL